MSICKKHLNDPTIRRNVLNLYRNSERTIEEVATDAGVGHHTVTAILKRMLPEDEFCKLKARKYSASKTADKNPAFGKTAYNFKGDVSDGRGYLTRMVHGDRYFVHRIVYAEQVLGIPVESLPESVVVHHIDEDTINNAPDNLAGTTRSGHVAIHQRYQHSAEDL